MQTTADDRFLAWLGFFLMALGERHVGLGSFGIKAPVLEHFRRITDTDTQYRLALLREEVMGQLEKTAAAVEEE